MKVQRTSLSRRLGSIAGLALAVASALVLAGSAPGAQLASQRSSDAQADLVISVNHQPEPACVNRFHLPCNLAYDVVGFHMLITNPSDSIAQGVGITVDVPPSDWIACCTPYSPPPPGQRGVTNCSVGDVNPHSTVTIDLSIRVHPDRGDLTGTVSSANDPNPDNNTAEDDVLIE